MTIRSSISPRDANSKLELLEACVEHAPEGTFEQAAEIGTAVGSISNHILKTVRELGLKANNSDGLREVEAIVYAYIRDSNPDDSGILAAEGFGNSVTAFGEATRDRVIEQIARDRDSLRSIRAGY